MIWKNCLRGLMRFPNLHKYWGNIINRLCKKDQIAEPVLIKKKEINGLYTYGRKICKVEQKVTIQLAEELKTAVSSGSEYEVE